MYVRFKKVGGRRYVLYSEDGSTWIDLQGDYDLVFTVPAPEIQIQLLQAPVLSIKTSKHIRPPWEPEPEKGPD